MSKKDFEAIAAILATKQDTAFFDFASGELEDIASRIADHAETSNPRFDRSRFLKACGNTVRTCENTGGSVANAS